MPIIFIKCPSVNGESQEGKAKKTNFDIKSSKTLMLLHFIRSSIFIFSDRIGKIYNGAVQY